ncbi:hypothetical protein BV898_11044 [Hypsibius exemplaris]|uniref:Uncharacterized protein n=1 Tax=Hypsibius exemplaris TaxID=2072580 RepID=A0A1W0WHU9_HYPEX|nr:hypothetical protein BV898_11044 [Hypsibius exemplaris]
MNPQQKQLSQHHHHNRQRRECRKAKRDMVSQSVSGGGTEGPYKSLHMLALLGGGGGSRAARMASSKTFFNPFCK